MAMAMGLLVFVTVLWAFSFSLIGEFLAGQVGYKHVMQHYPNGMPAYRTFGYFFFGALVIALPSPGPAGDFDLSMPTYYAH
jgi:drug/metabolite transporter (DMT)-like permease